jgi:thioredoxin 1
VKPTLLYFSTPGCAPCWSLQAPAIMELEETLGDAVRVVRVDAQLDPDEADRWGVFSVPTTIIVSPDGQLRHFNPGFVTAEVLRRQLLET